LRQFKVNKTKLSDLAYRIVKGLLKGKSDVHEAKQVAPHGIDSNPIEDMIAIYAATGEKGKPVVVGYINKNMAVDTGEIKMFSTDSDGEEQIYILLKNDGTAEVNGSGDNLVRWSELKQELDNWKQTIDQHITQTFTAHTHTGNLGAPTSPPSSPGQSTTLDMPNSKIENLKTEDKNGN
jgi:hypothetical protein